MTRHLDPDAQMALDCARHAAKLRKAFERAHAAELKAVERVDNGNPRTIAAAWKAAEKANAARLAWRTYVDEVGGVE